MTRRPKPAAKKHKSGGVLIGMRSGVKKVAGKVADVATSEDDAPVKKTGWSRAWGIAGNVLSVALLGVAVAVFLKRCGIVHF